MTTFILCAACAWVRETLEALGVVVRDRARLIEWMREDARRQE